jgi:hypothetical protein
MLPSQFVAQSQADYVASSSHPQRVCDPRDSLHNLMLTISLAILSQFVCDHWNALHHLLAKHVTTSHCQRVSDPCDLLHNFMLTMSLPIQIFSEYVILWFAAQLYADCVTASSPHQAVCDTLVSLCNLDLTVFPSPLTLREYVTLTIGCTTFCWPCCHLLSPSACMSHMWLAVQPHWSCCHLLSPSAGVLPFNGLH